MSQITHFTKEFQLNFVEVSYPHAFQASSHPPHKFSTYSSSAALMLKSPSNMQLSNSFVSEVIKSLHCCALVGKLSLNGAR